MAAVANVVSVHSLSDPIYFPEKTVASTKHKTKQQSSIKLSYIFVGTLLMISDKQK